MPSDDESGRDQECFVLPLSRRHCSIEQECALLSSCSLPMVPLRREKTTCKSEQQAMGGSCPELVTRVESSLLSTDSSKNDWEGEDHEKDV